MEGQHWTTSLVNAVMCWVNALWRWSGVPDWSLWTTLPTALASLSPVVMSVLGPLGSEEGYCATSCIMASLLPTSPEWGSHPVTFPSWGVLLPWQPEAVFFASHVLAHHTFPSSHSYAHSMCTDTLT